MQRKATDTQKAELLERKRKLSSEVDALLPSKRRDELRTELDALEKLLGQLGYRRLD